MKNDDFGERMKLYEKAFRTTLPIRMPVIIRLDGKSFSNLTAELERPFDYKLMGLMDQTAMAVCKEAQGAVFAFVQSDEISILLHNYKSVNAQAWVGNQVQKITSITAGIASAFFTKNASATIGIDKCVCFDSRVFIVPEWEVSNVFLWRQQDCTRNSIQMAARSVFSHKECENKDCNTLQEMLHKKGINWNDYPVACKRGRAIVKEEYEVSGAIRSRWKSEDPPIFSQDRDYINKFLARDIPEEDKVQ